LSWFYTITINNNELKEISAKKSLIIVNKTLNLQNKRQILNIFIKQPYLLNKKFNRVLEHHVKNKIT